MINNQYIKYIIHNNNNNNNNLHKYINETMINKQYIK